MKQLLKLIIKRGSVIGFSRDTGYRVYELYKDEVKSECVKPVFNRFVRVRPWYVRLFLNLNKDSYSKKSFKDLGYKDIISRGWDEFMWKGEPFGFHLQGAQKDGSIADHTNDMMCLHEIINDFSKR